MRVQKNQFFFGLGLTRAGRTAPDSINNYFAYKTMKADAGYGMASADENSFVNEKETAFSAEA